MFQRSYFMVQHRLFKLYKMECVNWFAFNVLYRFRNQYTSMNRHGPVSHWVSFTSTVIVNSQTKQKQQKKKKKKKKNSIVNHKISFQITEKQRKNKTPLF